MLIKDVYGFEEYFEIDICGNIYSKERLVTNNGTKVLKSRKKLIPCSNGIGYMQVGLCFNGTKVRKYIHRLVYETFVAQIPKGMEINHKDRNKLNNCLSNLELITHKENIIHWRKLSKATLSQAKDTSLEGSETTGEVKSS
jgi:hypothetical protein